MSCSQARQYLTEGSALLCKPSAGHQTLTRLQLFCGAAALDC